MESTTTRIVDAPFAECGTVYHDGSAFTAGGAREDGGRLCCYDAGATVTNWDGTVTFGRIIVARNYDGRGFGGRIRMRWLCVQRPDGSWWSGRYGRDWRSCVTLRQVKGYTPRRSGPSRD